MRYAITFTTDREWNTVDTIIVDTEKSILDMDEKQLTEVFKKYLGDEIVAENLATDYSDNWFVRNVDDVDICLNDKGELV